MILLNKLIMFILTQRAKNVLYLMYMNKEVIYLEPEDDITDILSKLQRAEQKVVALVPPKKATMLRSAVNMKLVAKAAKETKKVAVIVTADPAISKMAMMAEIPVAKTLQSRPVVPTRESLDAIRSDEQVIDEDLAENNEKDMPKMPSEGSRSASEGRLSKSADTIELTEDGLEKGSKGASKGSKPGSDGNLSKFMQYRKWIIAGSVAAVILVIFGVWALIFAPAAQIIVKMSTTPNNFSEEIRFTSDLAAENPTEGVLYAEKITFEPEYTENFEASGKEDRGDRAKGKVNISMSFAPKAGEAAQVGLLKGYKLAATTSDGKSVTYALQEDVGAAKFDGTDAGLAVLGSAGWKCGSSLSGGWSCSQTATAEVEATAAGEDYNIGAGRTWDPIVDEKTGEKFTISNPSTITGGSSKNVTVVTKANLDGATERILASHATEGKDLLFGQIQTDNAIIISSSFKSEAGEVKSTPALDAEVDENIKPEIKIKAVYSVYILDKTKVEEFIKAKASVAADQRVYSVGDPYVERFTDLKEPARLKTVVRTGPTVTEDAVMEKSKGRKIGEVRSLLQSINGVSSVEIVPSYFWVNSVPNDPNKVTIELTVEDK